MEKRYQVFVSSTFTDLKDERRHVIQTLMEMDCIPAGMELFPAMDEEQFNFIRKVIDDSDYYLLIVGGRYGSVTQEGVSYTEKEYDYAVSKGMKVLALLHGQPNEIPVGKSDVAPELREKLNAFRAKVGTGRLVKFWERAEDLPGLVALSLPKTIKTYPAIGWVRADSVASADVLAQVNQLRQENEQLRSELLAVTGVVTPAVPDIAGLDEEFEMSVKSDHFDGAPTIWRATRSWREIFSYVAPYLMNSPANGTVKDKLTATLVDQEGRDGFSHELNDQDFQTIAVQLMALSLATIERPDDPGRGLRWRLTSAGEALMLESRVVRASARK